MAGIFRTLLDFSGDGNLDTFEKAAEVAVLSDAMTEDEPEEEMTEFEQAGLDAEELEFMDANARRTVLEKAGLNPDEYDF